MTLAVVWFRAAEADLVEARAYYGAIQPELSERFAAAVKGRRQASVRRFPYGLFFRVEETHVVVVACFHGKRNPKHWQQRKS